MNDSTQPLANNSGNFDRTKEDLERFDAGFKEIDDSIESTVREFCKENNPEIIKQMSLCLQNKKLSRKQAAQKLFKNIHEHLSNRPSYKESISNLAEIFKGGDPSKKYSYLKQLFDEETLGYMRRAYGNDPMNIIKRNERYLKK